MGIRTMLAILAILLTSFTGMGCALFKESGAKMAVSALSSKYGSGKQAFQSSLLQAMQTVSKCSDCHTSSGSQAGRPFADSNVDTAYSAALASNLVTFSNVPASIVLTQLTNGHCGGPECSVTDQTVISLFKQAAQTWANAELASKSSSTTTATISSTLMPASDLKGFLTGTIPIVDTVSMDANNPTQLQIPLSALGANFGTSYVQFDVIYLLTQISNGTTIYFYVFSNPQLFNNTSNFTITLAGMDVIQNGYYDSQNRIFSDPTQWMAQVAPGGSASLAVDPNNTQRGMSFWGSPGGNNIALDFQQATAQ